MATFTKQALTGFCRNATRSTLPAHRIVSRCAFRHYSASATATEEKEDLAAKYKPKAASLKRFWKEVDIRKVEGEDAYNITLDGRAMKSPEGNPLKIPANRKVLALMVAGEWEGQAKLLKSYSLPLTSIVARSIDSLTDPTTRAGVIDNLLRYTHTDSVCYHQDYPDSFVALQKEHWHPLISWMKERYDIDVNTTEGILSVKQNEDTLAKLRVILEEMDNLTLAAFEKGCMTAKSFIIALALIQRRITVEQAAKAARLEVLHQIQRWGEVEDAHDVEHEEFKRQLGSVACALIHE